MQEEYLRYLEDEIKLMVVGKSTTSNEHHKFQCLLCRNKFTATPKSKVQNYKKSRLRGCPKCTKAQRYSAARDANIKKLQNQFEFKIPTEISNDTMLTVTNKNCNHTFTSKVGNLLNREVTCSVCAKSDRVDLFREFNKIRHTSSLSYKGGLDKYRQEVRVLTEQNYRKYKSKINPSGLERKRSGQDGFHLDHILSIKYCYENSIPEELCSHADNLRMIPWKDNAIKWSHQTTKIPRIFADYLPQAAIVESFERAFECEKHVEIVSPYVFNLYDSESKVGVIFHCVEDIVESKINTKKYLIKLRQECADVGIRLIQVFSDEWLESPEIVKSKIDHIFGISKATPIYARKTEIREIKNSEKNEFLKRNHIQGADKSQINLGAFFNNELVGVMTFCRPRVLMNKKNVGKEGHWELSRFATSLDYRVVGVASKMLKYFIHKYDWVHIYSYADLRWSSDLSNVYEQSGFVLDKKRIEPEYYYLINGKRMHRWGYRKDAIREKFPDKYDANKTEYENMLNLGIDRVWDCGMLKYVL